MTTTTVEKTIEALTDVAAFLVDRIVPGCEGACLGTAAVLARVLADHGIATTAVCGSYDEYAHWWLETDTVRIDPTRGQFDDGPLVELLALDDQRVEVPYLAERRFPARWDYGQAVAEFARMFEYGDVGEAHGRAVLAELSAAVTR